MANASDCKKMKTTLKKILFRVLEWFNYLYPTYGNTIRVNILKARYGVLEHKKAVKREMQGISMTNPDNSHAKEAIQEMLKSAEKNVYILCHELGSSIYEDYDTITALQTAYKRHPRLDVKVYLRKNIPKDSIFLATLISYGAKIYCEQEKNDQLKSFLAKTNDVFFVDDGLLIRKEMNQREKQGRLFFRNTEEMEEARLVFETLELAHKDKPSYYEELLSA